MKPAHECDILIIGGGMAGMTAAVYAARAGRSAVILEESITGGLANSTYTVENFPSYIEVHGMDLMQKVRDQVDNLGVRVEEICEIESLDLAGSPKRVETTEEIITAKAVILAVGRKPIPLDVPTECAQVHHCAICDGAPYKGRPVLVVGGGNSAFDEALYLLQLGVSEVCLCESMDRFFAAQKIQDDFLGRAGTTAFTRTAVRNLRLENGALVAAELENLDNGLRFEVRVEGVFVFLGQVPNTALFRGRITMDDKGYIAAGDDMSTNIPGVFSAGDANINQYRQLTTAAADGTIAALASDRYLRSLG